MSRGRRRLVRGLVILGSLLAFLSVFAIWTERQALNTDDWVHTSGRLLENETIRAALSDYLVDQLYENVDVSKELEEILPGDTKDLAGPAAGGLRQVAGQGAEKALETSTAQELWEEANRTTHEQLLAVLENKKEAVETEGGDVKLNLGSLLTNLAEQVGIGESLAEKLPPDAAQIEILKSDQLKTAQDIAVAIKGLALLLSILTLAAFGGAIYLSRDGRWVTVLLSGVGLIAAGFAVVVVRHIAGGIVVDQLVTVESATPAAEATWDIGTSLMTSIAKTVIVVGILFLAAGWLASPTGGARATRRFLAPTLRLHPAYVYTGAGDPRLHLLPLRPDPGAADLPHHPDHRRDGGLRDPRAAQADRGGVPRRQLRRDLRRHPGQSRQRGERRQHRRAGRRAGLEAAPAGACCTPAAATTPRRAPRRRPPRCRSAPRTRGWRGWSGSATLREKGILTEEEFAAEKARLLGGDGSA